MKFRGATSKKRRHISSVVRDISEIAKNQNFTVLPSTRNEITRLVKKSCAKGVIKTSSDIKQSIEGLISFGANNALEDERRRVLIKDVKRGFRNQAELALGKGSVAHTIDKCLMRTIVQRQSDIQELVKLVKK